MTTALYPGSFDPIHNGHIAILEGAAALFDSVVVGVGHNPEKPSGFFSPDERVAMIEAATSHLPTVSARLFTGLVTNAAAEMGVDWLVKGVRGAVDLDVEMQQAHMNRATAGIPSTFLPATGDSCAVSSTYVRQIGMMGGDISKVAPEAVVEAMKERVI